LQSINGCFAKNRHGSCETGLNQGYCYTAVDIISCFCFFINKEKSAKCQFKSCCIQTNCCLERMHWLWWPVKERLPDSQEMYTKLSETTLKLWVGFLLMTMLYCCKCFPLLNSGENKDKIQSISRNVSD